MREHFILVLVTALLSIMIIGTFSGCGMLMGRKPKIPAITTPGSIPGADPIIRIVEKMNWWIPLLILGGVGGGVFSFIMGSHRLGIKVLAGTLITVSITLGVMKFMWQFALLGFAAGILLMGYVIYVNRKAFRLTVQGIEDYKEANPDLSEGLVSTLSKMHGKDIDVKALIKQSKTKLRKKADKVKKKLSREVNRVVDQVKDVID